MYVKHDAFRLGKFTCHFSGLIPTQSREYQSLLKNKWSDTDPSTYDRAKRQEDESNRL